MKIIGEKAFICCDGNISDVEFGDKLETLEKWALLGLRLSEAPSYPIYQDDCWKICLLWCTSLVDAEFDVELETIEGDAFDNCYSLSDASPSH